MLLQLTWRNIWRNRRRTLITISSVFFAALLCILMKSIKQGSYDSMINAVIGSSTGYIQLHAQGYWDDQILDNSFESTDLLAKLDGDTNFFHFVPRIRTFALASSDDRTRGVMLIATDTDKEKIITGLAGRVKEGEYLDGSASEILLGKDLAKYLNVEIGDSVALIGRGHQEISAAGLYRVKGLVKFGSPDLNKQLLILPLLEGEELLNMEGRVTEIALWPNKSTYDEALEKASQKYQSEGVEVMGWETLMPDIKKLIQTDRVGANIFMFILYLVVSFGMLGTVLMMLNERKREMIVLISVGMKRLRLASLVALEILLLSLLGVLAATLLAFPVCRYFHYNPITFGDKFKAMFEEYGFEPLIQTSLDYSIYFEQAIIVGAVAMLINLVPFYSISRLSTFSRKG